MAKQNNFLVWVGIIIVALILFNYYQKPVDGAISLKVYYYDDEGVEVFPNENKVNDEKTNGLFSIFDNLPVFWASAKTYISWWGLSSGNYNPSGITTNGNYIYVADKSDDRVYKYSMSGTYQSSFYIEVFTVDGIAIHGNYVWVLDRGVEEVYKYDMSGNEISHFDTGASGATTPKGITTDGSYIYIVDEVNNYVYKYTMSGSYRSKWLLSANNRDSLGIATNGNYFWVFDYTDKKVYEYEMDGTYLGRWDASGVTGLVDGVGITYYGGYVWVVDNSGDRVHKYDVCNSHVSYECYNNDIYWYDSCGEREEKKEECGTGGCIIGSSSCEPATSISFEISTENIGDISVNTNINDATPIEFLNALDTNDVRNINKGESTIWNSELIDIKQEWIGTTQPFIVWIEGKNETANYLEIKSGSIEVDF